MFCYNNKKYILYIKDISVLKSDRSGLVNFLKYII